MSLPGVIVENCYTCSSCLVVKQICKDKNTPIKNIYRDKCDKYNQRKMIKCKLCGEFVINLASHVTGIHKKRMAEYKILTRDIPDDNIKISRGTLWD